MPETLDQYNQRREAEILLERKTPNYNDLICPQCGGRLIDQEGRYYGPSLSNSNTMMAGSGGSTAGGNIGGRKWIAMRLAVYCEDCNFKDFRYLDAP